MRASRLTIFVTSLLAGSSLLPSIAAAQSTANSSVETVVVTAEKRTEAAQNVPMGLTVLGEDQLNNLNIRSYTDLMAQVPGLSVSEGDPTHPTLILRGINAGGDGSTVGTYLDETPFGSSNALSNGTDTAPNLDTFDMQQVLVLKGPQGTLYGAGAEGGLIKFVTNAPDPSGFGAAVELTGFNEENGGFGESERGMVNVALTDDLAVRVVGFDVRTPGFIKDPNLGLNHANTDTSFGGRGSVLWTPTSKLSIRVNVLQQQINADTGNYEDINFPITLGAVEEGHIAGPLFGNYVQNREENEPENVRYYIYNATINWDLDFATLTSASSFEELRDFFFVDGSGAASTAGFSEFSQLDQGKFIQELRLASDPNQGLFGLPLDWLVGFYFTGEHDQLGPQQLVPSLTVRMPLLEELHLGSKYLETTGFANVNYHVTSNFEVGAGLRYATDRQNSDEGVYTNLGVLIPGFPPSTTFFSGASSHDNLTWAADARYHFDDNTMVYGRVATGWRPGGPNALPVPVPPGVPATFNPDSLIDYELGVKTTLPNENLSFDADVYDIEWRDIQLIQVVEGIGIDGNGGRANSKGFEANITWQPIDRLSLNLNGAFTQAELSNDAPDVGGFTGNALPGAPRWSGTLNADYTFLPIGDFTPYAGFSWHYMGIMGWGFNLDPNTGAPLAEGSLPGYQTLDFRVGVDWKMWTLELYGKNVNDGKGFTGFAPFGTSAASGDAASAAIIQPRVIGLVLRGKI